MRKTLLFLLLALCRQLSAQSPYWQQKTDYIINVALNDQNHTLDGFERLTYTNNSPDTLSFIWFHLWPNAYKNDQTAFSNQQLQNGSTDFYFSSKEQKGYINRLDFRVNGIAATWQDHPEHIDIIRLNLPAPLLPGQSVVISTPFHVQLPHNFSRGGRIGQTYQLTQWYPKPAVYDAKGWHPMPYLNLGEFYSEFGTFDVRITLPQDYVVAATGILQNEEERKWMLGRTQELLQPELKNRQQNAAAKKLSAHKERTTINHTQKKNRQANTQQPALESQQSPVLKTIRFVQDSVHDFALFAAKDYIVETDTCLLPSGKTVAVYSYYFPDQHQLWKKSIAMTKEALRTRSRWMGDYPYQTVSVVQGPEDFGGGMEYPTITVLSPMPTERLLEELIGHEVGHNWFYGALASNERLHPWLDEGLNSYYDYRYQHFKYGNEGSLKVGKTSVAMESLQELLFQTRAIQKTDQSIDLPAEKFTAVNYNLIPYHKTAKWLQRLEKELTTPVFDAALQAYYRQWKFRHPYPEDFRQVLEAASGKDLTAYFRLLNERGVLPGTATAKGWKLATPLSPATYGAYIRQPVKNLLTLSPAIGYNAYDKFMIGGLLSNYKLPPSRFQFVLAPLYATGSKKVSGIGRLGYSHYSYGAIRRTELFVNAAQFSMDAVTGTAGNKTIARFQKLVPGIRLTLREKDPQSPVRRYVQWKTYLIKEGSFRFGFDTSFINGDTLIEQHAGINHKSRSINQLQLGYQNLRELYPFDVVLNVEQAQAFIRPALTAHYFFNYAKGGGMQVRFFAGAFLYSRGKTPAREFATGRYHLNMTGPDGYEDYTYSNYFIGRNEFEGWTSQQIMMRDGGFKVRTNLLASKIGRSDQWLMALNFLTTIPDRLNPLSVLPVKFPLRIFADVGTHAEAWKNKEDGQPFLFDAGLSIPLWNETVNIYIPLLYSKPFKEYIRSTISEKRFWRTLSFSIQLNKSAFRRVLREIDL